MINNKAKDNIFGQMKMFILVILLMIKNKEMELFKEKMEI